MIAGILLSLAAPCQTMAEQSPQPAIIVVPSAAQAVPAGPVAPATIIPRDTPIELMAISEVSTANVVPGSLFKLRVNHAVEIDGRVVVAVGALAYGTVLTARESEALGKSGTLTAKLLYLQLGDARIPLEGDVAAKGRGSMSAVGAVLGAGLMGLFSRGNNAKIKAGEIVMGFVSADSALDLSGPSARLIDTATPAPVAPSAPEAVQAVASPAAAVK